MSLKGSNFVAGLSLLIFFDFFSLVYVVFTFIICQNTHSTNYFCFLATMSNETVVRRWGDLRRKVQVGQSDGRSLFRNIF